MLDVGTLPEWVTSVGGLLALLFAARAARTAGRLLVVEQQRDSLQAEEREQRQAAKVTAWWGRLEDAQGVFLKNSSDSAVYNATITLADEFHGLLRSAVVGTLPPSSEPQFRSCSTLQWQGIPELADTRLELGFTDAQSKHWLRNGEGQLSRITEQVVIWADENRRRSLEDFATQYLSDHGVKVEVRAGRLEQLFDEMVAGTLSSPDIFITSHDRVGSLAAAGKILELRLSRKQLDRFEPSCINAGEVGGKLYGLPYAMDTTALYTNLDLLGAELMPNSIEALLEVGSRLVQQGSAGLPLALPVAPFGEAFIAYPILSSALRTRDLFSSLRAGSGFTPDLTAARSVEALEYFQATILDASVDIRLTRQTAREEFIAGRVPFLVSTGTTLRDISTAPFRVGVSAVPPLCNGGPSTNLTLVQVFVLGSAGRNPEISKGLLTNSMTSHDTVDRMTVGRPQLPALSEVLQNRIQGDADLNSLHDLCKQGLVLRANPRVPAAWRTLNELEVSLLTRRSSVRAAAKRAQTSMERAK